MKDIGPRIKEVRNAAKLSQKSLATKVGVEPGSLGNWERGLRNPGIDDLLEINEVIKPYLGDKLFYLITGDSPERYLGAITINSGYVSKEEVFSKTEEFIRRMEVAREIRLACSMGEFLEAFRSNVLFNKDKQSVNDEAGDEAAL